MPAPGAVAGWPHQSCHSRRVRKCMCVAPASAPLELRAPAPQPEPRTGPPWAPALPPARPHAPLPRARQRTTSRRRVRRRPLARPQTHPKQRRHRRLRTRTRAASSLCGAAAHARETQHGRTRSGALSGTRGAAPLRLGLCTATMATAWTVRTTAWDGGARLPAAPVGAAAAAAGLSKPPSRSSTDAGAAAAGAAPRPAPEPGAAGAAGAAAARGATAGSVPSDAAMVGSTLISDSFLGPRPPSAAAPCAPRPR